MKTIFKKFDIAGLAVMLLAFFVAVGFTASNMKLDPQWYEVEITDEDNPDIAENQRIGKPLSNGPEGDCNKSSGELCAVELDITPGSPFPTNMHEADSLAGVSILAESFRIP